MEWLSGSNPKPKIRGGKRELFMFPLQITLALDKHSNSHKAFFSQWKRWIQGLQEFCVVPAFVWISPKSAKSKPHCKCSQWPAHDEWYVSISDVSKDIQTWYDEATRVQERREASGILPDGPREEETEEPEGTEEEARSDGTSVRKTTRSGGKGRARSERGI